MGGHLHLILSPLFWLGWKKSPKKVPIEKERAQNWDWICHSLEVCPFSLFKENRFITEALLVSILRVTYICDTSLNGCKGILLFICLVFYMIVFLIFKLIYISYKLISHTTVPFASFDLLCKPWSQNCI